MTEDSDAGGLGRCLVKVSEPPHYFHRHTCARPAKFLIRTKDGLVTGVCGVHHRVHERRPMRSSQFAPEGAAEPEASET